MDQSEVKSRRPGGDSISIESYEGRLADNLENLSASLQHGTYLPEPLRRVLLPKRDGGERCLSIPVVNDRIAQRAFVDALEPIFEPKFHPCSFGYRPQRGVKDAAAAIDWARSENLLWIVDADITDFFGAMQHHRMLSCLRERIQDEAIIRVIALWLAVIGNGPTVGRTRVLETGRRIGAGVEGFARYVLAACGSGTLDGDSEQYSDTASNVRRELTHTAVRCASMSMPMLLRSPIGIATASVTLLAGAAAVGVRHAIDRQTCGLAQGSPISPLLSNIYLGEFDQRITAFGYRLIRYADDFVICCSSEARAKNALVLTERVITGMGLSLNNSKTQIVAPREPFRFLGYEFDSFGSVQLPPRDSGYDIRKVGLGAARTFRSLVHGTAKKVGRKAK